jgi:hypothetical protein
MRAGENKDSRVQFVEVIFCVALFVGMVTLSTPLSQILAVGGLLALAIGSLLARLILRRKPAETPRRGKLVKVAWLALLTALLALSAGSRLRAQIVPVTIGLMVGLPLMLLAARITYSRWREVVPELFRWQGWFGLALLILFVALTGITLQGGASAVLFPAQVLTLSALVILSAGIAVARREMTPLLVSAFALVIVLV